MRMSTRLFVSAALGNGAELEIAGEQARYLGRVLRARVGDRIAVFNGNDGEWAADILAITKGTVRLALVEPVDNLAESPLKVHLVQGISRGERMDFVLQKATELGAKRITPVLTDYGVVKLDARRAEKRREHWQRIAESACEQCGRVRPPLVDAPVSLNRWFGEYQGDSTQLVLKPGTEKRLDDTHAPTTKVCLLIGPEGGFSDREYGDARAAGFDAVSIGPRILRTETAAVAALTIVQALWGDL